MEKIESQILRLIRTGEGDFNTLALALFAHQFELNKPYQAYARQLGKTPGQVKTWKDIPAVPVAAFKSAALATFPINQAAAHFESSGTTRHVKSHHFLKTLTYYESALQAGFDRSVLSDQAKLPLLLVTPSPAEAPRSSLAWMMDVLRRRSGAPGSRFFVTRGRVDELFLMTFLARAQAEKDPVAILGTTIGLLSVLEALQKQKKTFALPAGSRLMDTGGLKSDQREISRPEFVRRVTELLGIPDSHCWNEYGMCELSSQCYGKGTGSYLQGPAWMKTVVIDPQSGEEARAGQPGLLRHFDLANVDSVLAIQTDDVGLAQGDGFVFQGRDPQAEVRGCSQAAEAFLHA